MSIISLTSDYGLTDYRVAAMKGCILAAKEDVKIVDISHQIEAYNLAHTAYLVKNTYRHFPKGSVHIIAVDSFYSKHRKSLLYKANEQYFIAADNGVLSLIFDDIKPEGIFEITMNNRFDDQVASTVTDIFIPIAIHLTNGGLPEVIGRKIKTVTHIKHLQPNFNSGEKMIVGNVLYIDHFGNVVTNISKTFFEKENLNFQNFKIIIRKVALSTIFNSYTEVVSNWENEQSFHGKAYALFNEAGYLEIAIYKGSKNNGAQTLLGLDYNEKIYIEFE